MDKVLSGKGEIFERFAEISGLRMPYSVRQRSTISFLWRNKLVYLLVLTLFGFLVFLNFNTCSSLYHLASKRCTHQEPSLSPRGCTFSRMAASAPVHFSAPSFQFSRSQCSDPAGFIFIPGISPAHVELSPPGSDVISLWVLLLLYPHYLLVFYLA